MSEQKTKHVIRCLLCLKKHRSLTGQLYLQPLETNCTQNLRLENTEPNLLAALRLPPSNASEM